MKTLYFVRHGETDWNTKNLIMGQRDLPLNEHGRLQASAAAQRLAQIPFTACYSSDLCRARETAEIILTGRNLTIHNDPRLREIQFGIFEGVTATDWPSLFPDDFAHFQADILRHAPAGAESRLEVMARVKAFLSDTISSINDDCNILVLTHGGTLSALFNVLLAGERNQEPTYYHRIFRFDNCGVSILRHEHEHWRVVQMNGR